MNKKPPIDIWSRPANMMMVLWWHWWWFVPNEEEEDNDDLCRTAAAARRRIEESLKRKVFRRWVLLILLNLGCSPSCHTPPTLIQRLQIFWKQADKSDFSSQKNLYFQKPSQTGKILKPFKTPGNSWTVHCNGVEFMLWI